jgi:hypothetical protein
MGAVHREHSPVCPHEVGRNAWTAMFSPTQSVLGLPDELSVEPSHRVLRNDRQRGAVPRDYH